MKAFSLRHYIVKSLIHYRKMNVLLVLGSVITSTVITGSLILGDSVRHSLKSLAYGKTGRIQWSLYARDRFISSSLAAGMEKALDTNVAPLIILNGIAGSSGGRIRVNDTQILGVDERFFKLSPGEKQISIPPAAALINQKLAQKLNLEEGEEFTVSIVKPAFLPADSLLSRGNDYIGFRLKVLGIIGKEGFGDFSLKINPETLSSVFISLSHLADKLESGGKANALLVSGNDGLKTDDIENAFRASWGIEDAGYEIKNIPEEGVFELRTERVFLSDNSIKIIKSVYPEADYISSYFVNSIRKNGRSTPYSIVSSPPLFSHDTLTDDRIIINTWLAQDLNAQKGDRLELEYFVIDNKRKLQVRKSDFIVHSVVPVRGSAADRALMPDFPGLSDEGNCRDWNPGIPIDLDRIREKDEQYWDTYRGTPKAFISLNKARNIWGSRFGHITGIRFKAADKQKILNKLNKHLGPEEIGLYFEDIRDLQVKSSEESVDFSQLFLGLSFFVVISSLVLTGLFFIFYIETRSSEVRTLYALGYRKNMIYRLFLSEGALIAIAGSILGIFVSIIYNHAFLYALGSLWYDAVRTETLSIYIKPVTVLKGFVISTVFALSAMYFSLRSLLKKNTQIIQSRKDISFIQKISIIGLPVIIVLLFAYSGIIKGGYPPVLFFTAGTLLLMEGLIITFVLFRKMEAGRQQKNLSVKSMGIRNINRNPGRSLAVTGLLSVGIFMVISVSSNRSTFLNDTSKRESGTGGFALFGRTTYPVNQDLNSVPGRRKAGLNEKLYKRVKFVQMRLRAGDDASCLNPNRTFVPQVLGVNPGEFAQRGAFTFAGRSDELKNKGIKNSSDIWPLLETELPVPAIPAIADQSVIQWGLGKQLGDSIVITDDNGNRIQLKLIAGLANSIFQGYVIISEEYFLKHFPSVSGFGVFLVDGIQKGHEDIINDLSRAFLAHGIEVSDTAERLAEFNSVQDTYLSIFLVLGGFGLILGTIGLGALILRNVLERKGEIALLKAVGYTKKLILKILFHEYLFLLLAGILIGSTSACLAVLPIMLTPGTQVPYLFLILTVLFIASAGILSIYYAGLYSVKGSLLGGLREE